MQKTCIDYYNKPLDNLWIIRISPSPTFSNHEKEVIATSFRSSSKNLIVEMTTKIILTRLMRHWNENKSSSHQKASSISPPRHVSLNIFSIGLK